MIAGTIQTKFANTADLSTLPWFEPDQLGRPQVRKGAIPTVIDVHTHVAMSFWFSPGVDIHLATEETQTYFPMRGNPIDLEKYSAECFCQTWAARTRHVLARSATSSDGQETHTLPNLIAELDRTNASHCCLLAIELPMTSRNSENVLNCGEQQSRVLPFASVHPLQRDRAERVFRYKRSGARGIKLHPAVQLVAADHPNNWDIYDACRQTGLPILFHTGHSEIQPELHRQFTVMSRYEAAIRDFPGVNFIFGHGSIHMFREAIEMAQRFGNIFFEISGQQPERIRYMLDQIGAERIMFGSDWPLYPICLPLAKALIATENCEDDRAMLLNGTARSLFRI